MLVLCLCACSSGTGTDEGNAPSITKGQGSQDDPWQIGKTDADSVTAFLQDGEIWVDGAGEMMDFESPEDCPWAENMADIERVSIFGEVTYIGKNAFAGAGANVFFFDIGIFSPLESIGDGAFAGCGLTEANVITIPESVTSIGAKAFDNCGSFDLYIDGAPAIADNAFANDMLNVFVRNDGSWNDANMLPYGGELTYKLLYLVDYVEDYGTEDMTGEGTVYVPEDELLDYNFADYCSDENYHFVRYEITSGDVTIADPENPQLSLELTGNIGLKVIFEKNA